MCGRCNGVLFVSIESFLPILAVTVCSVRDRRVLVVLVSLPVSIKHSGHNALVCPRTLCWSSNTSSWPGHGPLLCPSSPTLLESPLAPATVLPGARTRYSLPVLATCTSYSLHVPIGNVHVASIGRTFPGFQPVTCCTVTVSDCLRSRFKDQKTYAILPSERCAAP